MTGPPPAPAVSRPSCASPHSILTANLPSGVEVSTSAPGTSSRQPSLRAQSARSITIPAEHAILSIPDTDSAAAPPDDSVISAGRIPGLAKGCTLPGTPSSTTSSI